MRVVNDDLAERSGADVVRPGCPGAAEPPLLRIDELSVSIPTPGRPVRPVDRVSIQVARSTTLGLVGESGSGKSMLMRSIMGIAPAAASVTGQIWLGESELLGCAPKQLRSIWGRRIAMVFQDSMSSLNPVVRVGRQVGEAARKHLGLSRAQARERTIELLERVGIPEPARRASQYPHELSGGMRQRVAIAVALSCDPELLIADEATTALDVTVQQQILDLLAGIQAERQMTMIIVSHDLGVVASRTDRIAVMYGGRIVEVAQTEDLFAHRRHQYTQALLGAVPRRDAPRHSVLTMVPGSAPDLAGPAAECRFAPRCPAATDRCRSEQPEFTGGINPRHQFACFHPLDNDVRRPSGELLPPPEAATAVTSIVPRPDALLQVEDLIATFKVRGGVVHAVSGISFDIMSGETLGLVGESGCGKSTTVRRLAQLPPQNSGTIRFDGIELGELSARELRGLRSRMQLVLQDPIASLNPHKTIRASVAEGLLVRGTSKPEANRLVDDMLREVGLDPNTIGEKKPFQLSGGQCQRAAIARAIILAPSLLICDEPVSSLDVSVRAQVLNLLQRIKNEHGLAMLFVSHDLGVVRNISDRVAVMYLGKIVEIGDADVLYNTPAHPYTQALINAIPEPDPQTQHKPSRLSGDIPSPLAPPSGCRFRTRCPRAQQLCTTTEPPLAQYGPAQAAACHFPLVER
jgi:peptide/nickel transport system ATP-binding protein